jgi:hypothetical protein
MLDPLGNINSLVAVVSVCYVVASDSMIVRVVWQPSYLEVVFRRAVGSSHHLSIMIAISFFAMNKDKTMVLIASYHIRGN